MIIRLWIYKDVCEKENYVAKKKTEVYKVKKKKLSKDHHNLSRLYQQE